MRGTRYQLALIALSIATVLLMGYFFYIELFPEYRIYQKDYVALEEFRSSYTGEAPPPFSGGVKQIVMLREDKGPPEIDRCISCHVAISFEHFSPTALAYDINGNLILDPNGFPKQIPNEEYVWKKLDEAISSLKKEGKESAAARYEALKTAHVGEHTYDVTKVLRMHPLIGKETRPFEYHSIDDYGCTSCHGGNGRGLTTEKAHGPIFDEDYEHEFTGVVPQFYEKDPNLNDPAFAAAYNHKPGHTLLFQTTPLLVGGLIEAKCVQCHKTSGDALAALSTTTALTAEQLLKRSKAVKEGYENSIEALATLYTLQEEIAGQGLPATLAALEKRAKDPLLDDTARKEAESQAAFLRRQGNSLSQQISRMVGPTPLVEALALQLAGKSPQEKKSLISAFIAAHRKESDADGTLFAQADAVDLESSFDLQLRDLKRRAAKSPTDLVKLGTELDLLTRTYQRGEELYFSQACYACHRIAGLARGGVGPELTQEGHKYPWFIKESIVWPQADLKTSTMPNYILDHQEIEALMTFLLAQTGKRKIDSEAGYKRAVLAWEGGKKTAEEEPLPPVKIHDLDYAMTLFATEGCAACHRLRGFESTVGFTVEKGQTPDFDTLYAEEQWFQNLFPEELRGSQIVSTLEQHGEEIERRISAGVRKEALLDQIEKAFPDVLEAYYPNFKYALRAKNHEGEEASRRWQQQVHKVLMVYIEQYGLGRLIGPRPNWSGIYRTDEWLMEHFHNPSSHVARSIMPVFPFDDSKFYALTYMLDQLAVKNRDKVRQIWEHRGFNPEQAFQLFCSQCHGENLLGNGPVSKWIYPIPKNLRNADFLRNLTRENAYEAVRHGVKGTPMPPWGEVAPDKAKEAPVISKSETLQIVDWLFSQLPGGTVIRESGDVLKWKYGPEQILDELKRSPKPLKSSAPPKEQPPELTALPRGDNFYASLTPTVHTADVTDYFDVSPPLRGEREKNSYYIKKRFYTPENLAEGEAFFLLNCAVCHGNDADGSGNRAPSMENAKPRMLTNLDWLHSRDDLRLLRSIKYGVPGTAMVAWGDQTNILQRMQLVMYIRSVSGEAALRKALSQALYATYNEAIIAVENALIQGAPPEAALQKELSALEHEFLDLQEKAQSDPAAAQEAVAAYQKQLALEQQISRYEAADSLLKKLEEQLQAERSRYEAAGISLIQQRNALIDPEQFFSLIRAGGHRLAFDGKTLSYNSTQSETFAKLGRQLLESLDKNLAEQKRTKAQLLGKIASADRDAALAALDSSISANENLKAELTRLIDRAPIDHRKEQELVEQYNQSLQQLSTGVSP